ncbi:MAG: nickel pincer cofactor biosynthesis protein LarB [Candidatus Latescibacteria bacterium]|nr:nickel pincer cofactor biosynthesis protein LarB [Candidatus Latescibacterota bacterium]
MDKTEIRKLLEDLEVGKIKVDEALEKLKGFPYEDLGFAKIDSHRSLRKGFPEVIFSQSKSIEQIKEIVNRMQTSNRVILAMRATEEVYQALKEVSDRVEFYPQARAVVIGEKPQVQSAQTILIVTGGTADIPVAEEAAVTAEVMGNRVERLYDVGVAGLHRLLGNKEKLFAANVLIVVAGMEGALPSVVGGLVDKPVIAVPTSVGYGANFQGLSALLAMLNSCAPGMATVNIDNGFGAGYLASLINQMNMEKE